MAAKIQDPKAHLLANSTRSESGCLEWDLFRNPKGYGMTRYLGNKRLAHRVSYTLFVGDIPEGSQVLHSCDNPCCIEPAHLSVGSNMDNVIDKVNKGRAAVKLTEETVLAIRAATGTQREIAAKFNIGHSMVHCIVSHKSWRHI